MARMMQAVHPGLDSGASGYAPDDTAARHWPEPPARIQLLAVGLMLLVLAVLTLATL